METEYRHFVRICNSPLVFCRRYGFKEKQLGSLLHAVLFALLKANQCEGVGRKRQPVYVACWAENMAEGGETYFEVNEETASAMFKLNGRLSDAVKAEKTAMEAVGRSFLLQQCKSDLFSEI